VDRWYPPPRFTGSAPDLLPQVTPARSRSSVTTHAQTIWSGVWGFSGATVAWRRQVHDVCGMPDESAMARLHFPTSPGLTHNQLARQAKLTNNFEITSSASEPLRTISLGSL
jgi:hypothetical protein